MTDSATSMGPESDNELALTTVVGRGIRRRVTSPPWLARAASVGLATVSLAFVASFIAVLGNHGLTLFVAPPPAMRVVTGLPYVIVVLAVGTTAGAVLGWRRRYWSFGARVHQTVLAVLGLVLVWQLFVLGFLP